MEMQDMLADRLKQKRALSHASLEEYSKELGISKSALQKYEAPPSACGFFRLGDRPGPVCVLWRCTQVVEGSGFEIR